MNILNRDIKHNNWKTNENNLLSSQWFDLLPFEKEINLNDLQEIPVVKFKERQLGEMFLGLHVSVLLQN